jgi:hypothetical protein
MAFTVHSIYGQIFKVWRKKRRALFSATIRPQPDELMLDVGGYPGNWTGSRQEVRRIDCLNVHPVAWQPESAPAHAIRTLVGDGCALDFPDLSYDVAFSNSVIEHVGDWDRQRAFAREVRRVGRRLWVQTPAYECPFEPHFLAPFVHWIPVRLRKFVVRWLTPWGWIVRPGRQEADQAVETTRLLTRSKVAELFPDCEILTERLLAILPKSYIAVRRDAASGGRPERR